jgi:hypothetical protein
MAWIRFAPLYPRMLRSRWPVDEFEVILTPGWHRLLAEDWLAANDPGDIP